MHPALRKGPLFLQNTPPISFPAYGPVIVKDIVSYYCIEQLMRPGLSITLRCAALRMVAL